RGRAAPRPCPARRSPASARNVPVSGSQAVGSSNGMATTEQTRQRAVHAERAKKKADERREQASGAAGWVADRAGQWSLDAQDLRFMELQKYFWNPLIDYWFRMDVEGWEQLPEPPTLLVGINSGAPIVPIATVGGPDSMPVLATGRRIARALRLDKVARLKMFPFALQAPWGLSPAILPEIPLPTKIRTAFQEPIEVSHDPAKAKDDAYLEAKYREVEGSIQRGMDALARRRRLPLFG